MTVTDAWNGSIGLHWADHPDRYNAMPAHFDEPLFDAAAIGAEDRIVDIGCGSEPSTRIVARRAPRGVKRPQRPAAGARTSADRPPAGRRGRSAAPRCGRGRAAGHR